MGFRVARWIFFAGIPALAACAYEPAALAPPGAALAPAPRAAAAAAPAVTVDPGARAGSTRPLVAFRFAAPEAGEASEVAYAAAFGAAVRTALAARPWLRFTLLAAGPRGGEADRLGRAEAVLRRLSALGVAPERVRLVAAELPGAPGAELRLYLR